MNIILTLFIALFLGALGWSIFLFKRYHKIKDLNLNVTKEYRDDYAKASKENRVMKERIIELENGINDTFSVSVRKDVTKVECLFNKVEMAFLMAGVYKLLNDEHSTIDDKEFYIKLYKKIQENIDQMEEEPDES